MAEKFLSSEFRFVDDGFVYKNTVYKYKNVRHTVIYQRVIKTTYNVVGPTGEENEIIVKFITDSGEELTLQETMKTRKLIGFTDDKIIEKIRELFIKVSNKTFKNRLGFYERQVNENGYFVYFGGKFFPSKKIILLDGVKYSTETHQFLRSYGSIEFKKNNESIFDKMKRTAKRELTGNVPSLGTLKDSDVFFYLLDRYYGIRWS